MIKDGAWSLPTDFGSLLSNLVQDLNQMVLLIVGGELKIEGSGFLPGMVGLL